jgi:nucleotide-binding universal stress UspA family protein
MEKKERILVPLDGTPCSENILPKVERLASDLKSGICLLRVVHARTFPGADPTEAQVTVVREAEEYLQKIEDQLKAKGLDADSHVRYGDGVREILDHATQKEVDLIAMSTHGRTGIKRWLLGSTAEKIVENSPRPVFVARCA